MEVTPVKSTTLAGPAPETIPIKSDLSLRNPGGEIIEIGSTTPRPDSRVRRIDEVSNVHKTDTIKTEKMMRSKSIRNFLTTNTPDAVKPRSHARLSPANSRFCEDPVRRLLRLREGIKKRAVTPENERSHFNAREKWKRIRNILRGIHRLNYIAREIQLYGSPAISADEVQYSRLVQAVKRHPITMTSMDLETHVKKQKPSWLIIYPEGGFKIGWTFVMVFVVMYSIIMQPLRLAFLTHETYDAWWVIQLIVDILLILDVFISCCTAFENEEGELVTSHIKIFHEYLRSWLAVDLIACFPFSLILTASGAYDTSHYAIILDKTQKLIRLYELLKMLSILKWSKGGGKNNVLNMIIDSLQMNMSISLY